MASWSRDGIAGLQSVVLYSLPELDGAIDTVPLGGLVGDNIFLVSERVTRLSQRIKKWVHLRRSQPQVSLVHANHSVLCQAVHRPVVKAVVFKQHPGLPAIIVTSLHHAVAAGPMSMFMTLLAYPLACPLLDMLLPFEAAQLGSFLFQSCRLYLECEFSILVSLRFSHAVPQHSNKHTHGA